MENFFCYFFASEIIIRFFSFRHKWECARNGWFLFDLFLAFMGILDTWILTVILADFKLASSEKISAASPLRLVRLVRLTRIGRLMRMFPSMIIVLKGLKAAVKAMSKVFLLLVFLLYTFAVIFKTGGPRTVHGVSRTVWISSVIDIQVMAAWSSSG